MQVREAGGPDKDGQACPSGDQSGPSLRTCNSTYMQGCLWPRGLLPCVPAYSGSIGLACPSRALLHCPLALGRASPYPESRHHGPLTA